MAEAKYRLSDFGTIYLTREQRQSLFLVVVVEVLNTRKQPYESASRLPPQGVWAYVTQRWRDAVQGRELEVRYRKQKLILWDDTGTQETVNNCIRANSLYLALMEELVKKPNIPPLPPSILPVLPVTSNAPRTLLLRPGAISVSSLYDSDMDVTLFWGASPEASGGGCAPPALPDPLEPPIAPALPTPPGNWAGPQPPVPPLLPPGSPPIGGGSLNTGGGFPGDQSIPETTVTQTTLRARYAQSSPSSSDCTVPPPVIEEYGPFPGVLGADALTFVPVPGWPIIGGFPCGANQYRFSVVGPTGPLTFGTTYNGTAPPESIEPIYS
jgi:hypothetical protein